MNNIFLILLVLPVVTFGQQASIQFDIENATAQSIEILLIDDLTNPEVLFGEYYVELPLNKGKTKWVSQLSRPISITVYYGTDSSENNFEYHVYLSPGDNLHFSANENDLNASIAVSGKGSENNQPAIQPIHDVFLNSLHTTYKRDTLPNRVLKAINEKTLNNYEVFNNYLAKFHPSQDFIKNETLFLKQYQLSKYFYFKGSHKFRVWEAYYRNEHKWQRIEDSLIEKTSINDDELLYVSGYSSFLFHYLLRTKERLWKDAELKNQYCNSVDEQKMIEDDPENLLREKIISKHFTGKTAEFLYALIFQHAGDEKDENLPEIFSRFQQKYPNSEYHAYIEPRIEKINTRRNRKQHDKMIFITSTDSLQTFDDVLEWVKGKTVLLDMWGTWCAPCRKEFSQNSDAIKRHFKGRGLSYLYIANNDLHKEKKWRALVAYYNLEGSHILANKTLTKNIMNRLKSNSYPTYVIIKKDGTFEKLDRSMTQIELFKKLDAILIE